MNECDIGQRPRPQTVVSLRYSGVGIEYRIAGIWCNSSTVTIEGFVFIKYNLRNGLFYLKL